MFQHTTEILTDTNKNPSVHEPQEEIPATLIPKMEPESVSSHDTVIPNLVVERVIDVSTAVPFDLSLASKLIPNVVAPKVVSLNYYFSA